MTAPLEGYTLDAPDRNIMQTQFSFYNADDEDAPVEQYYVGVANGDYDEAPENTYSAMASFGTIIDRSEITYDEIAGIKVGYYSQSYSMDQSEAQDGSDVHYYQYLNAYFESNFKGYSILIKMCIRDRDSAQAPECWMLYMDFDNRLLTQTVLCKSLLWWEAEYVRQSIREALAVHARYAILVEFKGTQALEMENEEKEQLLQFSRALRGVEVELLDNILAGESGYASMNAKRQMDQIRNESFDLALHERYAEE